MEILGLDIGGSGIKGAPVNINNGVLQAPRYRIPTPQPSKPASVASVVAEIAEYFSWNGPIGCGFPAPMRGGVALTAANIHKKWIGKDVASLFAKSTGCPVCVINDADAAGLAEMKFGMGKNRQGVVIIITIGTGLGTALFSDGHLFPNAELGHLEINGTDAELRASDAARKREKLSWKKWGKRFDRYLHVLERLLNPDLFILGGGTSKRFSKFSEFLSVNAEVQPAMLLNEAGIVGAALAAQGCQHKR